MVEDDAVHDAPTRRDYVKYGGAVLGSGLLAGCDGQSDSGSTDTGTPTETADQTEVPTDTETATPEDESYSVSIAPVGAVEFDEPPEDVYTAMPHHADMALALGRGDDIKAIVRPELFDGIYNKLFARFDDLSVEWADLFNAYPTDKETLYEFDSDVHLEDPAYIASQDSMDPADIEEIGGNVSPWFGNTYSNEHSEVAEPYAANYQYYTLWEIFGKVSRVFQEQERYEALTEIREGLLSTIESNLPPEDERPRVARVLISFDGIGEGIWAYSINGPGFVRAHTRPLGAKEAFPDLQVGTQVDLEALVEAEPDVLLRTASFSPGARWTEIKNELRNDPVAQEIPAVANDQIYPLAYRGAGPILHLYQLEMAAKQVYPDQFGQWPEYDGESYPEIPESEQLFDHQRVADIIMGDH